MNVVATVLGLILLVVVPAGLAVLFLIHVHAQTMLRRRLRATPLSSCRDLASGLVPTLAKVTGTAVAGPQGPLRAPISGRPCVWYSIKVERYNDTGEKNTAHTIYDKGSTAPFGLTDGTGSLTLVLPDGELHYMRPLQAKRLVKSADERLSNDHEPGLFGIPLDPDDCRHDAPRHYQEWIVPPGADVTALGEVDRNIEHGLVMRSPARMDLLVAPETEQQLSATIGRQIRGFRIAAIVLFVFAAAILIGMIIRPPGS